MAIYKSRLLPQQSLYILLMVIWLYVLYLDLLKPGVYGPCYQTSDNILDILSLDNLSTYLTKLMQFKANSICTDNE